MINLDLTLQTIEERIDFINNLLDKNDNYTGKELDRMGEYLLYLYDKQLITTDSRKEAHERVMKDKEQGKKTYIIVKKHKEKVVYDDEKREKIEKSADTLRCIEENLNDIKKFKEKIKEKNHSFFNNKGLSKQKILGDINKDVSDLEKGTILFNTVSHGGEFNKFDRFNLNDIDYTNEDFIYEVLRNMHYIELQSPPSNLFFICMDFVNATENINFTKHQRDVLYKIKYGEDIRCETETIRLILKKYSTFFKKTDVKH